MPRSQGKVGRGAQKPETDLNLQTNFHTILRQEMTSCARNERGRARSVLAWLSM